MTPRAHDGTGRGPRPKRSLGQNFLHDQRVLESIAVLARPNPGSGLLEVGPGTGNLTRHLLAQGVPAVLIERDARMVAHLAATLRTDNTGWTLVEGDASALDLGAIAAEHGLGDRPVAVGNLPYYAAMPILFRLLEARPPFARLVLMVQLEVARRLTAEPSTPDYGLPTVVLAWLAYARIALKVGPGAFTPVPKVWSAVLVVEPLATPRFQAGPPARFRRLLEAGFGQRRKTLANALSHGAAVDPAELRAVLASLGLRPDIRAEALSLEQWCAVARALTPSDLPSS